MKIVEKIPMVSDGTNWIIVVPAHLEREIKITWTGGNMAEIKVGDIIRTRYGRDVRVLKLGTPPSYDFWNPENETWAYCEVLTDDLQPVWYKMSELNLEKKVKCECGAVHDRHFPSFHAHYCPMFKERK